MKAGKNPPNQLHNRSDSAESLASTERKEVDEGLGSVRHWSRNLEVDDLDPDQFVLIGKDRKFSI